MASIPTPGTSKCHWAWPKKNVCVCLSTYLGRDRERERVRKRDREESNELLYDVKKAVD